MMWYLQLTNEIGHWYTTRDVFYVLFNGIKKPIYMNRWNYFKAFVRAFYKGFRKNKPIFSAKLYV